MAGIPCEAEGFGGGQGILRLRLRFAFANPNLRSGRQDYDSPEIFVSASLGISGAGSDARWAPQRQRIGQRMRVRFAEQEGDMLGH